jgi:uncharacterized protein
MPFRSRVVPLVCSLLALALAMAGVARPAAGAPPDLETVRRAAESGDVDAELILGHAYLTGVGVPEDLAAAWFTRAAEQDVAGAQETLGEFYRDGKGVKKDDAMAVKWFQRAAEGGDATAQFNLGVMYRNGRGISPDPVEAHKWIMLAAARVSGAEAEKSFAIARDNHAAELTPAQVAQAQKRARDWMDAHLDREPPPTPAPPQAIRVGGQVKQPTRVKNVPPVYPDEAKQARVQGVVIIECTIGIDGRVVDAKVLRSIPLLDQTALDAVRQWEYTRTVLDGAPVPVIITVTVNFTLS